MLGKALPARLSVLTTSRRLLVANVLHAAFVPLFLFNVNGSLAIPTSIQKTLTRADGLTPMASTSRCTGKLPAKTDVH